jgi:hypothetical protein
MADCRRRCLPASDPAGVGHYSACYHGDGLVVADGHMLEAGSLARCDRGCRRPHVITAAGGDIASQPLPDHRQVRDQPDHLDRDAQCLLDGIDIGGSPDKVGQHEGRDAGPPIVRRHCRQIGPASTRTRWPIIRTSAAPAQIVQISSA